MMMYSISCDDDVYLFDIYILVNKILLMNLPWDTYDVSWKSSSYISVFHLYVWIFIDRYVEDMLSVSNIYHLRLMRNTFLIFLLSDVKKYSISFAHVPFGVVNLTVLVRRPFFLFVSEENIIWLGFRRKYNLCCFLIQNIAMYTHSGSK